MDPLRSKDTYQKDIYHFMQDMYVVCPACSGKALVKTPAFSVRPDNESAIKLICTKCGHSKLYTEKPIAILSASSRKVVKGRYFLIGGTVDPYFHLPLWFTATCGDNILWAYNYEHIDFLKSHVEAKLRERNTAEMSNKSLGSRLPKWMTSKKNREAILKALEHLKKK